MSWPSHSSNQATSSYSAIAGHTQHGRGGAAGLSWKGACHVAADAPCMLPLRAGVDCAGGAMFQGIDGGLETMEQAAV